MLFLLDSSRRAIASGEERWPMPARPSDISPDLPGLACVLLAGAVVMGFCLYITPPAPGTLEKLTPRTVLGCGLLLGLYMMAFLTKGSGRRKRAYDQAVALRRGQLLPGRVVEARHIHNVVWTGDTALLVRYEFTSPEGQTVQAQAVQLDRSLPPENAELAVLYGDPANFVLL